MKINKEYIKNNNLNLKNTIISVGTFDGLHKAHSEIIQKVTNIAKKQDAKSIIFTFEEPPKNFFSKDKTKILNLNNEKITLLEKKGIDFIFVQKFDVSFANKTAEEFIYYCLIQNLGLKTLVIGDDHKFGKGRSGDYENLKRISKELNFEVVKIDSVYINDKRVSSTNIRNYIQEGRVEEANQMLDYEYFTKGKVVSGKQIGREIGFPTANLEVNCQKLLPKLGVYAVLAEINGRKYPAMCNIGFRPSINISHEITIEVHIINFNDYIYEQEITLHFSKKIRDEQKFDGVESLVNQLKIDKLFTIEHFKITE